ncbi:MAG: hypothetical protein VKO39_14235 [Cyanobacteriota bacterium]|nr:hypothetical protein [Cyanobacteriota bacterium]
MDPISDASKMPPLDALRALIEQERRDDPLVGAKVGSKVALEMLLDQLTTEQGVHAETLMALAGVLVGQSVQASLWAEAKQEGQPGGSGLQRVRCHDGSQVFVGDPINRKLMEGFVSPWQVLSEAARQEGCGSLPEAQQLLLEGVQRIGTPAFGHPQVPASHLPQVLAPSQWRTLWRLYEPLCAACCQEPADWPLLCGLLAARALRLVKPALVPDLALRLAMDAAIDAAKLPLLEADGNR